MIKGEHTKIELNAQKREILGSAVRKLRKNGYIPGILYGKGTEPIPLQVLEKDFSKVLKSAGESTLVYINIDGEIFPTIINDVVRDPVSDAFLHADFQKVRLDEKIKAMVQVVFEGESPAVVEEGGIFVRNVNELEVEALPQNLPHEIKIDISSLKNFGDQVLVKDINLGADVKIMAEPDEIVGTVQAPISEEELKKQLEAPTAGVEEVEVIEREKKEEEPAEEGGTGGAGGVETSVEPAKQPAKPQKEE